MICVDCLKTKPKNHGLSDSHLKKLADLGRPIAVKYDEGIHGK
jgi:hypothetical protein